ncbi:hypothetical protein [Streptomyces sp. NPDC047972]|uniref:hypothetical protein n=1 Tax=Streptomyces sp. NPDC047972 TaxID=3365493 RepID=UPI00371E36DC
MHVIRNRRAAAAAGLVASVLLAALPTTAGSASAARLPQPAPAARETGPARPAQPPWTGPVAPSARASQDTPSAHGPRVPRRRGAVPALGRVLVNPATVDIRLPFDSVTDTRAEWRASAVAQNRLTTRCMARYGITYVHPDPAPVTGPDDPHRHLFGFADPVFAAAHGYDRTGGVPRPPRPEAPPLTDDGHTALYGHRPSDPPPTTGPLSEEEARETDTGITVGGLSVPVHGCGGEAYRKLYLPTRTSIDSVFPFMLSSEAHARATADPRMRRVFARWSRCMARHGYPGIANPYEVTAVYDFGDDLGGPAAVAAAVRDVACKQKVNLVGLGAALETAHQKQVAAEVADDLAAYRVQRAARLARAAALG